MEKQPSYEELLKKISQLENKLSNLKSEQSQNPFNINQSLFFEISEYSKNAIALFETKDGGKSFIIKYFNKKAEEIEKVKRENVIGKNLAESFPSVLNSGFLEALQRVFRLSVPEEFPAIVFSSGKIIEWRHNYIYKLSDDELVSIYIDETENKIKDYELNKQQEKFKSLVTLLPEVIYETDIHGNITFANLKAFDIFGYTPEDLEKGLNIVQIFAPEEIERVKENFEKVLKAGNVAGEEYIALTKSGKKFPILVYSNVIKDGENIKGLRGIVVNISDLKKAQEQLRTSEENFRQLSENITDAFWLRSLDNKVIYSNSACYKIVGENFKDVFEDFNIYKKWIHPDDRKGVITKRENNLKNQDKNHFYEHRIIKSDGEVRWLWIRTFPVFNEKGELFRRAGIASDITEQKKLMSDLFILKEKAEESDRLKSAFLANMSHEIRTPMNGILGFAELLKADFITNKEKSDYLKIINLNGKQLLNLINDILDVAKIGSNQLTINKEHTEINPLLKKIYHLFIEEQKRLKKQKIKFFLKIPDSGNNIIFTDITRLQQILYNLLSNAFKFTDYGSVNFGYEIINNNDSKYYQFFVSDTGIGITKNMKKNIFERFGKVLPEKYKNQSGTGLGLAISKGLIELLNGKIWLESTPENILEDIPGGSTFYFTIPIINNVSSDELS
jgi:PAS domain S-box-containing protein